MNPWLLARLVKGQLALVRGQRDALYELVVRAEESLARHEPTTAAALRRDAAAAMFSPRRVKAHLAATRSRRDQP